MVERSEVKGSRGRRERVRLRRKGIVCINACRLAFPREAYLVLDKGQRCSLPNVQRVLTVASSALLSPSDNLSSPNEPESSPATPPGIALVLLDPGILFVPKPDGRAPRASCAPPVVWANRDLLVLGEEERAAVVPAAGEGKVAALTGEATSVSLFSLLFACIVTDVIHGGMRLLYKGGRGRGRDLVIVPNPTTATSYQLPLLKGTLPSRFPNFLGPHSALVAKVPGANRARQPQP